MYRVCAVLAVVYTVVLCHPQYAQHTVAAPPPVEKLERCAIEVGTAQFRVEIARTPAERQRGLMHRDFLAPNTGMLFLFSSPQLVSFWMKNTSLPLTIGYFDQEGILIEIHDLEPFSLQAVPSSRPVRYALELERGSFDTHKIAIGSRLRINCPRNFG